MATPNEFDVAIVGAGVVGLANAWMAAQRGNSVVLFERDAVAQGATVRNFGMIWPIGQPFGQPYETAIASRQKWLELADAADIWHNPCGSIHLAHHRDEWDLYHEFASQAEAAGIELKVLDARRVLELSPATRPDGLIGGLFSPTEVCVNSRVAIEQATRWLVDKFSVVRRNRTLVSQIDERILTTSSGERIQAERIVVCGGADLQTLYPDVLQSAGLRRCKLHMLATAAQPAGWRAGPLLTSGLTCRHYPSFATCQSVEKIAARIADAQPDLDRFGIHVMASQNDRGEVVLGDSHEYDDDITPFATEEIDDLILSEAKKLIALPDFTIQRRWTGTYVKCETGTHFERDISSNIKLMTGLGGAGMTLSFGLADQIWNNW